MSPLLKVNGGGSNPPECIRPRARRDLFLRKELASGWREESVSYLIAKFDETRRAQKDEKLER